MTKIQKEKRIRSLLRNEKSFFHLVDSLAHEYEELQSAFSEENMKLLEERWKLYTEGNMNTYSIAESKKYLNRKRVAR